MERHAALHVSITLSSLILRFLDLDQRDHAEVGIVRQKVRCESCRGPSHQTTTHHLAFHLHLQKSWRQEAEDPDCQCECGIADLDWIFWHLPEFRPPWRPFGKRFKKCERHMYLHSFSSSPDMFFGSKGVTQIRMGIAARSEMLVHFSLAAGW